METKKISAMDRIGGIVLGLFFLAMGYGLFDWIYSNWTYWQDGLPFAFLIIGMSIALCLGGVTALICGFNAFEKCFDHHKKIKEN
jgi:hypothetical protein